MIDQLRGRRASSLRPGGRVIVLQPNIRLVGPRYWDFIDHKVALTERSLLEAAELAGLRTVELITRFLPYSTKGRLPASPRLVRAYLAFRPAWRLLGRQTLFVGERACDDGAGPLGRHARLQGGRGRRARPPGAHGRGHDAARDPRRVRLRRGPDRPGHRAAGRRAADDPRPPQRPGSRRAQRDEGRHRRARPATTS